MTTTLHEKSSGYRQGRRAVVPESNGARIRMRIMGWEPGADVVEGSSGDYPIAAIKRDFREAFPIGTRSRANHDGMCDAGGDVRRVMAKSISEVEFEEDGAYYWARAREGDATDFLRQFADVIGTSVSVGVELEKIAATDDDGEPILDHEGQPVMVNKLSERGVPIVKRFLSMSESPYNSVDFVEAPGADGAVVSIALEAARGIVEHTTLREAATFTLDVAGEREKTPEATPPRVNKKEKHMDEQEQSAFAERVGTTVAAAVVEALRPSAPTSDQPTLEQAAEAVVTAGLTEAGRRAVYARLDRGEALEAAIAAEVEREANIDAEVERRLAERQTAIQRESVFDFGYTTDDKTGKPLGTEGQGADTLRAHEAEFDAAFQEG